MLSWREQNEPPPAVSKWYVSNVQLHITNVVPVALLGVERSTVSRWSISNRHRGCHHRAWHEWRYPCHQPFPQTALTMVATGIHLTGGILVPLGGLHSTATDLGRFLLHMLGNLPGPPSLATRQAMLRDQIPPHILVEEPLSQR
ncbi:MAG: hypothetical protein ACUVWR_04395 [Anaerolineae bacterium]